MIFSFIAFKIRNGLWNLPNASISLGECPELFLLVETAGNGAAGLNALFG